MPHHTIMKTTTETDSRPLAERVTQGAVTCTFLQRAYGDTKQESAQIHVAEGDGDIARVVSFAGFALTAEDRANAELIAEAFNITHETGRTPRQLAEDVKELRAAMLPLLAIVDRLHRDIYAPNESSDWKEQADARAILAKTEPTK